MKIITLKVSEDEAGILLDSLNISEQVAPSVMKKLKSDKKAIKAYSAALEFLKLKIQGAVQ